MIHLNDALNIMSERDKPFNLKFVTCDLEKNTGGEIIEMTDALRCGLPYESKQRIGVKLQNEVGHPIAVHQKLIIEFNGEKVFW